MFGWLCLLASFAHAEEYFLEVASVSDRAGAAAMEQTAEAAGFDARVVRRFRLGRGWEFVVLVEHFAAPELAAAAAARLELELGTKVSAWRLDAGEKVVALELPPPTAPGDEPAAAEWIARAQAAHGGATGGSDALARAGAVHFRFARELELDGKRVTVLHDYWREGASRRLAVESGAGATSSLSIATANGAWIRADGRVMVRDIGVTIGVIDAFAPEAVLTVALEAARLLDGPEVATFHALEGAESGLRFGSGGDESEPGLTFVDIDPGTAQISRVRYVSEAGPITFELAGWRRVEGGVFVPQEVRVERADGRREVYRVEGLELLEHAPPQTFDKPA